MHESADGAHADNAADAASVTKHWRSNATINGVLSRWSSSADACAVVYGENAEARQ